MSPAGRLTGMRGGSPLFDRDPCMPTYFCFIERDILTTPHMEPLSAETDAQAMVEAEALLRTHASGIAAHVLREEERIGTVRASRLAAG